MVAHFWFPGRRNRAVCLDWSDLKRVEHLFAFRAGTELAWGRVPLRICFRHALAFATRKPLDL